MWSRRGDVSKCPLSKPGCRYEAWGEYVCGRPTLPTPAGCSGLEGFTDGIDCRTKGECAEGRSCVKTEDCADGLECSARICTKLKPGEKLGSQEEQLRKRRNEYDSIVNSESGSAKSPTTDEVGIWDATKTWWKSIYN
jgi:hypothetical protein